MGSSGVRALAMKRRIARHRQFRKGYNRTGGFYGRFRGRRANGAVELKFFDLDVDDAIVASGGLVFDSLNKIAQGTTENTRIGRKCTIKRIGFRFEMQLGAQTAAAAANDVCRVIIYLDKQCNGATANVSGNAGLLVASDYQAFNNLSNTSRFRVLLDRTYDINIEAGGGDGTAEDYGAKILSDSFYKRCNIPIEFDSTAGAITEIRSNNLGLLVISKSGLVTFNGKIRIRFSDS